VKEEEEGKDHLGHKLIPPSSFPRVPLAWDRDGLISPFHPFFHAPATAAADDDAGEVDARDLHLATLNSQKGRMGKSGGAAKKWSGKWKV
jgi:hypothetical protein